MYSLNRTISRTFQTPVINDLISSLENNKKLEKIKNVGMMDGFSLFKLEKPKSVRYVLLNEDEFDSSNSRRKRQKAVRGYLFLENKKGFKASQVDISFLSEELRGLGIGKKLYEHAIFKDNVFLMSGNMQTPLSQRLWKSLAKNKRLFVWAQDLNSPRNKCQVEFYDDELHCNLDIWYDDKTYWKNRDKDIRLFAIPAKMSHI